MFPKYEPERQNTLQVEVQKMLGCHHGLLGYAEYICEKCLSKQRVCFTCKGKFCPKCGKLYTDKWVERMKGHLLEVEHRHVVFTIPDTMRPLIWTYHERLLKLMMDRAAQTIKEVIAKCRNGLEVGIVLTVHTFGRNLKYNPHVHVLVTEGGLARNGQWRSLSFIPFEQLRRKWQYLLLTGLREELGCCRQLNAQIDNWFQEHPQGFYVHAQKKLTRARNVARYLGRYLSRPAIAQQKIIFYDGDFVRFWYDDHKSGLRVVTTVRVL